MTEEKQSGEDGRGFTTIEQYAKHSQCAVYLAKELFKHQKQLSQNDAATANIYDNSWEVSNFNLDIDDLTDLTKTAKQLIPGTSLYIFVESVPVFITLRWFMQCVVLAKDEDEGGVERCFLALLNQGQLSEEEEFVPCTNYEKGSENIIAQGVNNPREQIPLEKWLCTAPFLFTLLDSTDESDIVMHAM
jgi:hypothetical protein